MVLLTAGCVVPTGGSALTPASNPVSSSTPTATAPRPQPSTRAEPTPTADDGAWVVVNYRGAREFDLQLMDQLEATELAAADALEEAGLGTIDGNEIGDSEYQLFFVGQDAQAMWTVLAPILAKAPVAWDTVELRRRLEDPAPAVLRR